MFSTRKEDDYNPAPHGTVAYYGEYLTHKIFFDEKYLPSKFYHVYFPGKFEGILKAVFGKTSTEYLKQYWQLNAREWHSVYDQFKATLDQEQHYNVFINHGKNCHPNQLKNAFEMLKNCDNQAKIEIVNLLFSHILRMSTTHSSSTQADEQFSKVCVRLATILVNLSDAALINRLLTSPVFKLLIEKHNIEFYESLVQFLQKNNHPAQNVEALLAFNVDQIEFCNKYSLDVTFLDFMVAHGIHASKVEVLDVLFGLYPNDLAHASAINFLQAHKDLLLKLNSGSLAHLRKFGPRVFTTNNPRNLSRIINEVELLTVLSSVESAEDQKFIDRLFEVFDEERALKAVKFVHDKGFKKLTVHQKAAVEVAFRNTEADGDEKFNLLAAMFAKNYTSKVLQGVAKLYILLLDRATLLANLDKLEADDNLLTPPYIELLETLHNKGVGINFDYAKHLSSLLYLRQFKEVIALFPEEAVQAIFNRATKKATAGEWVKAFMIQAYTIRDPELFRKVVQLVFGLWTFAEANAKEIGLNRNDLLGSDFNNHFVKYLSLVHFEDDPTLRFALLADMRSAAGLLMLTDTSSPAVAAQSTGVFAGLFGTATPQALENGNEIIQLRQQMFNVLQVNGLDQRGNWRFRTQEDLSAYAGFMRSANARMGMVSSRPQSYLALTDGPSSVSSTAVNADEQTVEQTSASRNPNTPLQIQW